ncbi:hypothetical protein PLICRDRAFT_70704, partial [Plicaturopsis crispa FD-325 SS-3]
KKAVSSASLGELQKIDAAGKKKYLHAQTTSTTYDGYIDRCRLWIKPAAAARKLAEAEAQKNGGILEGPTIDAEKLYTSLDGLPNSESANAIEFYIVQKCLSEGKGKSTAEGAHAAWIRYYDQLANEKYRGPYTCSDDGVVSGNPARAAGITDIIDSIKHKAGADGGHRNHADALTIEHMEKIMAWSEGQYPGNADWSTLASIDDVRHATKHLMMRAFLTSGFTIWTRNFELCGLRGKHVEVDCPGAAPYFSPYLGVRLENRKGWQRHTGIDGPLTGHRYKIYPQKLTPAIDMHSHLGRWIQFEEDFLLERKLQDDECIFPQMAVNGVLHMQKEMTHDAIQKCMDEFVAGAGIKGRFTTHSPRRGGSQYRFMFAPIGQRWSLMQIRWWGGWAVGEHANTLIKYLLDELTHYENDHSDALCPIQSEMDKSFNGDHVLIAPATVAETRELAARMDRKFETVIKAIQQIGINDAPVFSFPHAVPRPTLSHITGPPSVPGHSRSEAHIVAYGRQSLQSPNLAIGMQPPTHIARKDNRPAPPAGLSIPTLCRGPNAWREAVKQWEEPDSTTNLALKDWPVEYYTGDLRGIYGAKRTSRKTVAEEYERLNRDDNAFIAAYPEANKGFDRLVRAIRVN